MLKTFDLNTAVLALVDVQERFVPAIAEFDAMLKKQVIMLNAAKELKLSLIINEQYPKGLGHTVPELKGVFAGECPVIEKISFSCFGSDEFRKELAKFPRKTVVLMGIETHVCVQQTAFDALNRGYDVILLADAVGSRKEYDRDISIALMRQCGIVVTTVESFLFAAMKDAKHPAFKAVSTLVR